MIAAPVRPSRELELRGVLSTMNEHPGWADPANPLVPFRTFDTLHFARFVVLKDATLQDLDVYGTSFRDAPIYLAFLGDCDGSADMLLADFANRAGEGLGKIFDHCAGFDAHGDLLQWMRRHSVRPAAT